MGKLPRKQNGKRTERQRQGREEQERGRELSRNTFRCRFVLLATGFGSGAAYTVARMVVKTGVTFAEGKVKAAHAVETVKAKVVDPVTDLDTVEATVIPPARNPLAMSDPKEDTRVW